MNRRQFFLGLGLLGMSGLGAFAIKFWPRNGMRNPCYSGLPTLLSQHPLMQQVWQGIDPSQVWDSHVHITGTGDSGNGIWFNPNMDSLALPILKAQKWFYMNGGCVSPESIDSSYTERLKNLCAEMPSGFKSMLYAFDKVYDSKGKVQTQRSIFYVPNAVVRDLAKAHPAHFEWVASIHPYRADSIDLLQQAVAEGARAIKWLPSGMGINPASAKCRRFYQVAAALNIPIISHTGRESAIQGGNQQDGNPLLIRHALDQGVRVVLAHCASDGEDTDLDQGVHGQKVSSFSLFSRLMADSQYQENLRGDISAITLFNHAWVIQALLEHTDWHERLINGSDYPLPGILPLVSLEQLRDKKLLDEAHIDFLHSLRGYNALLFDFALKRLLQVNGQYFPASVFHTRSFFEQSELHRKHHILGLS